jgi:hypothetical protein
MIEIRAFVGHSFAEQDRVLVHQFLSYFDEVKRLNPNFSWETAKRAEPRDVAEKVLRILSDKNLFIGICTKKERVIADEQLRRVWLRRASLQAEEQEFRWKTSDWAIQEIGLAMGKQLPIIASSLFGVGNND